MELKNDSKRKRARVAEQRVKVAAAAVVMAVKEAVAEEELAVVTRWWKMRTRRSRR